MNILDEIRTSWGWIGINPEEVIDENDFGNLIVKDTSGKVWRIPRGRGSKECGCVPYGTSES